VQHLVLRTEVESLIAKRAIALTSREELRVVCPLFVVPKAGNLFRPVHNLKPLNELLVHQHFKMESLNSLFPLLQGGVLFY
jgi:hypothetical protein